MARLGKNEKEGKKEKQFERESEGQSESREDTQIIVGSGGEREDLTRRQMGDGKKRHFSRSSGDGLIGRGGRGGGGGGAVQNSGGVHGRMLRQMPRKGCRTTISCLLCRSEGHPPAKKGKRMRLQSHLKDGGCSCMEH